MRLLFLVLLHFAVFAAGGASTPAEEIEILLQFKSSFNSANETTFRSWNATNPVCGGFAGIQCDSAGSVSQINLTASGLSGRIRFDLLCRLGSLSVLSLGSNYLSGVVSNDLRNCTGLRFLDLAFNALSGAVPDLSPLDKLQVLNFTANGFSGAFPWSSLAGMSELEALNVGDNSFDPSMFPDVVLNLTKLNWLYLSHCNIHGKIPPAIGNLTRLINLEIADSFLTGMIPPEITKLSNLRQLELYNSSLEGRIPTGFGNLSKLVSFDASMNRLGGDLSELRGLTNLVSLQLFDNDLSGEVPPEFGDFRFLTYLSLYSNRLSGTLPLKLGSWSEFNYIDVSTNFLTGPIPPEMCRKGTMEKLLMLENKFTGKIPASYANCSSLLRFRVNNNSLSGEVPAGLWSLPNLNIIDLAINQFEGQIGAGIGAAKSLNQLFISNNRFSGRIPPEIGEATAIVNVEMYNNHLYGDIPESIGRLRSLASLYLQNNLFSGEIPEELGSCVALSALNLAGNELSGPIPATLGKLVSLNSLDLSNNQISGEIPANLATLKLSSFDLSNNSLTGDIPAGLAISAYSGSFSGNPGLCVDSSSAKNLRSVRHCSAVARGSTSKLHIVLTCILSGTAVFLVGLGLYIVSRNQHSKKSSSCDPEFGKDLSWDMKSFHVVTFDEKEIVEGIKPENLLGKGGSGEVYRVKLTNGEVVAVKQVLCDRNMGAGRERSTTAMLGRGRRWPAAAREFEAEVRTLSEVRHVNVVKLYCSITSEDWSLLVYEHLPNGSLWDKLHGPAAEQPGKAAELGWEERCQVALGAARGLEYLHHSCDRPILHRDVKSSNILLDECLKPRIADFGLAKILNSAAAAGGAGEDYSAPIIAGTHGYIAPEYAYTWKVNEKSDVYSFGVVLMELVTGRQPIEAEYGEEKDIVHWVSTRHAAPESAVDSRIRPGWEREAAVKILRVAVLCTARLPVMRPSMRKVVQMLEEAVSG